MEYSLTRIDPNQHRSPTPKGVNEGTDRWLRIIVAIGDLGDPPTDAQH